MGGRQGLLEDAKKKAKLSMSLNLGDLPVRKEKYFSYKGKKKKKKCFQTAQSVHFAAFL